MFWTLKKTLNEVFCLVTSSFTKSYFDFFKYYFGNCDFFLVKT